nr:GATOR complex protein MIOS-A isoform X1 [Onthophagus taurus]
MASRLEILWSPIKNKFITWGSEICLYEIQPLKDQSTPLVVLSNTSGALLLATNSNYHYVKCIDIYPKSDKDILLGVGHSNGRVTLSSFGQLDYEHQSFSGKELVPRHQRSCNALAWNPVDSYKIVAGLDKNRSDSSILLWDITKTAMISESSHIRPVLEYGLSETTHSLAWINRQVLAAGMNNKSIKILDFRDSIKLANSATTKAVLGVNVNVNNDKYLASFSDHQLNVWDTRNFDKPVLVLPHGKLISKISWCPTKQNLLGVLQRDSSALHLYDIQQTLIENEEVEPSVIERVVTPGTHSITSFSWNHSDENRFLASLLSGQMVDYTVYDRITLNWASNSNLIWTCGRKTLKYITNSSGNCNILDDISEKIKDRANKGYGLNDELWRNGELANDDSLATVWNWLHLSKKLVDEGVIQGNGFKHPGIKSVLKYENNVSKSEPSSLSSSDTSNATSLSTMKLFKQDRDKALHLCGWHVEKDSLTKFLEELEKNHLYTRAAAIAVFHKNLKSAIEILSKGAEDSVMGNSLNVVAMALAGYSEDKGSMWRQFCSSPRTKLDDAYLRAMFAFLTAENGNYDDILYENEVSVNDRIGFACLYLSDTRLNDYLKILTSKLTEEGNLDGLLLTGNTFEGIKILQKYLDRTSDIQTTALISVRAFNSETLQELGKDWVNSYRSLLDSWQYWHERANFDIMLCSERPTDKPPQQVYISCNFCGKSISAYMQGLNRGRGNYTRMGSSNKIKMSACPACRKPLPRCAICLMHMGTTTGDHLQMDNDGMKVADFSHWFTWCQTCRHGGHASHMLQWFKEHSECPVTACTCKCFCVDTL